MLRRTRLLPTGRCFSSFPFDGLLGKPRIKHHKETVQVSFPASLAFEVVADIDSYHEFVPWCTQSRVVKRTSTNTLRADLTVGYKVFTETYTSNVTLEPHRRVHARSENTNLFNTLNSVWTIEPVGESIHQGPCTLSHEIEFGFRSSVYDTVGNLFFDEISGKMVSAFTRRCEELHMKRQLGGIGGETMAQDPTVDVDDPSTTNREAEAEQDTTGERLRLRSERIEQIRSATHFTSSEFSVVHKRFKRAIEDYGGASGQDDKLDLSGFRMLLADFLECKPSVPQDLDAIFSKQFRAFDLNNDKELDLREFVAGVSILLRGSPLERCRFWFRCYDINADGYITQADLKEMVKATLIFQNMLLLATQQEGRATRENHPATHHHRPATRHEHPATHHEHPATQQPPTGQAQHILLLEPEQEATKIVEYCCRALDLHEREMVSIRSLEQLELVRTALFS